MCDYPFPGAIEKAVAIWLLLFLYLGEDYNRGMKLSRLIIDVREPFEFESGHVGGAINIPPTAILSNPPELESIDRDTEIIVYCRSGSRSNTSIQILKGMGFTNLVNGINAQQVVKNYRPE